MELPDRLAASVALSRLEDPRDLVALQFVPLSRLTMGSPEHPNSEPVHEVVVRPFAIGRYPITVREYK
ncbi:UNVERIFIED_CONTAM: formylglycine-generating enzyme family protein, partial [Bacteroidetes bacterium 56_B9]